jgi:hypothetical protein
MGTFRRCDLEGREQEKRLLRLMRQASLEDGEQRAAPGGVDVRPRLDLRKRALMHLDPDELLEQLANLAHAERLDVLLDRGAIVDAIEDARALAARLGRGAPPPPRPEAEAHAAEAASLKRATARSRPFLLRGGKPRKTRRVGRQGLESR